MFSQSRMIRLIDEKFVESFIDEMICMFEGNYEVFFILCKDCEFKVDFDIVKLYLYIYEVIGGVYNIIVGKKFNIQFFENFYYWFRYVRIYVGLNDEEVLWLGIRYNLIGEFCYFIIFLEEVFN